MIGIIIVSAVLVILLFMPEDRNQGFKSSYAMRALLGVFEFLAEIWNEKPLRFAIKTVLIIVLSLVLLGMVGSSFSCGRTPEEVKPITKTEKALETVDKGLDIWNIWKK